MNDSGRRPFSIFQLNPFLVYSCKYDTEFIATKFHENNNKLSHELADKS